jgi:hypothetical protein
MGSRGVDASGLVDRLREQEEQLPTCPWCGRGRLYVLKESLDPNFGALGVVQRTLKCDWVDCGKLTVD